MAESVSIQCPRCRTKITFDPPDKQRSPQEHRTFFGIVKVAFDNWPERHPYKPENVEALRSWLLIQVGHCDEMHVPGIEAADVRDWVSIAKFTSGTSATFRAKKSGDGITFLRARSLALKSLEDRERFHDVAQRVYGEIQHVTGIDVDRYVRGEPQHADRVA